jgi:hypothetical protein
MAASRFTSTALIAARASNTSTVMPAAVAQASRRLPSSAY